PIDKKKIFVGELEKDLTILDQQHNRTVGEISFLSREAGKFMFIAKIGSTKGRLLKPDTCYIEFYSEIESELKSLEGADSPVFIVRNSKVIDIFPRSFWEFNMFKLVFLDETPEVDLGRATIWFKSTYLGSLGGIAYKILKQERSLSSEDIPTIQY